MITSEGIDELIAQGYPVFYAGALGENLTTTGLDRRQMRLGQRYRAGEVMLEITKDAHAVALPRWTYTARPSSKPSTDIQVRANNAESPRWGLAGFYARVIRSGLIRPKDMVELVQ